MTVWKNLARFVFFGGPGAPPGSFFTFFFYINVSLVFDMYLFHAFVIFQTFWLPLWLHVGVISHAFYKPLSSIDFGLNSCWFSMDF